MFRPPGCGGSGGAPDANAHLLAVAYVQAEEPAPRRAGPLLASAQCPMAYRSIR